MMLPKNRTKCDKFHYFLILRQYQIIFDTFSEKFLRCFDVEKYFKTEKSNYSCGGIQEENNFAQYGS